MQLTPPHGEDWVGLTGAPLPVDAALSWAGLPHCGAVVLFCGTVRDHAEGRSGVTELEYEAYEEEVAPRLAAIAADARCRWPVLGRVARSRAPLQSGQVCSTITLSSHSSMREFASPRCL